ATGLWKWHRLPRYHSWSFKYSAGAMGFTLPTLLIGEGDGRLFRIALGAAILAHGENIAITCAMRTWSSDVPSLWHLLPEREQLAAGCYTRTRHSVLSTRGGGCGGRDGTLLFTSDRTDAPDRRQGTLTRRTDGDGAGTHRTAESDPQRLPHRHRGSRAGRGEG